MWLGNEIGITFKKCRISIMKIDSNLGKGSRLFRCDIYMVSGNLLWSFKTQTA